MSSLSSHYPPPPLSPPPLPNKTPYWNDTLKGTVSTYAFVLKGAQSRAFNQRRAISKADGFLLLSSPPHLTCTRTTFTAVWNNCAVEFAWCSCEIRWYNGRSDKEMPERECTVCCLASKCCPLSTVQKTRCNSVKSFETSLHARTQIAD